MTPQDVEILRYVGEDILSNLGTVLSRAILYGLYLPLFIFSSRTLLKRGRTRTRWILLGFFLVLFLCTTAGLALSIAEIVNQIRGTLIDNADQPLLYRLYLSYDDNGFVGLLISGMWLNGGGGGPMFVFGDMVVVWRAWVLWSGNRLARIVPSVLLFISAVFCIMTRVLITCGDLGSEATIITKFVVTSSILEQTFSLATNVVATMLIGYRAYQHRELVKATIGLKNSTSTVILLFLTESGTAFCILQAVNLAMTVVANSSGDLPLGAALPTVAMIWTSLMTFAGAAYPMLVILIVEHHKSISDHVQGRSSSRDTPNRLSFQTRLKPVQESKPPVSLSFHPYPEEAFAGRFERKSRSSPFSRDSGSIRSQGSAASVQDVRYERVSQIE